MKSFSLFSLVVLLSAKLGSSETNFVYNGFLQANLSLDAASVVTSDGILSMTDGSSKVFGHAFHPYPLQFMMGEISNETNRVVATFSTNFIFSMIPKYPELGGHGLAFVLVSTKQLKGCLPNQYLGLPNDTSDEPFIRILAVEFDTVQNLELEDINDNHVGIDTTSLTSVVSEPAAYYMSNFSKQNGNTTIVLKDGNPIQAWIDYESEKKVINVTISPLGIPKPSLPLISFHIDLSLVLDRHMYAGFSASTGLLTADHNVHGWSFRIGGKAEDLVRTNLPFPEANKSSQVVHQKGFAIGITLASVTLFALVIYGAVLVRRRMSNEDETLEDWEIEHGAYRFKYSQLYSATNGFGEKNLIGSGGFGRVYKGVIPSTKLPVAIKQFAHDSRQGMREFVAEITSMRQLRHRNLVQLHGWCRKKDELLLVYDYIPNGSLDNLMFEDCLKKKLLTWDKRYTILTGVAQALLYLHEQCDHRVIHRDVKTSNVLIDAELNSKLGDFGLSRMYDHGINPRTTHVVGTLGYMAPELTRTGKASTSSDVFGYGILLMEVACGRKPIDPQRSTEELLLVDWVSELHSQGEILGSMDPSLDGYDKDQAQLVLTLGLLCTRFDPDQRPSMRYIVQLLLGDASLPLLPIDFQEQNSRMVMPYPEIFSDESDPSTCRMSSSKSNSSTSFDQRIFSNQIMRKTF